MTTQSLHGVIDQAHLQRKTDYLFRISMKCLVSDDDGRVLVVKEAGRTWWDLPGGGMDHSESIAGAIARELHEEVRLTGGFNHRILAVEEPAYLQHVGLWQVRLVFAVYPENMNFELGDDASEVAFIDPAQLKNSANATERKVFEYTQLATKERRS